MLKKQPSNISNNTFLSKDFKLAFGNLSNYLERIRDGESARARYLAKRAFLHRPIPYYEDFFNPSDYENVVNESNKLHVLEINKLIDKANYLRMIEEPNYELLSSIEIELFRLIL